MDEEQSIWWRTGSSHWWITSTRNQVGVEENCKRRIVWRSCWGGCEKQRRKVLWRSKKNSRIRLRRSRLPFCQRNCRRMSWKSMMTVHKNEKLNFEGLTMTLSPHCLHHTRRMTYLGSTSSSQTTWMNSSTKRITMNDIYLLSTKYHYPICASFNIIPIFLPVYYLSFGVG